MLTRLGKIAVTLAYLAMIGCTSNSPMTSPGAGGHRGAANAGAVGGGTNPDRTGAAGTGGTATAGTGVAGTGAAGTGVAGTRGTGVAGTGGTQGTAGTSGTAGSSGGTQGGAAGQRPDGSAGQAGGAGGSVDGGDGDWIQLLNGKELTGWTPSPGAAPLFAAEMLDGEPVIHVYPTQPDQSTTNPQIATLRTAKSYTNYVFHEEYKWATKRFGGRKQTWKDNGICFQLCNNLDMVWPDAFEFQIGSSPYTQVAIGTNDWVVGEIYALGAVRADWTYTTSAAAGGKRVYSPTGMTLKLGQGGQDNRGRVTQQLNSDTDWNILELTVHGATSAEYNVNGMVVNKLTNMECNSGGTWKPANGGPVALQAEYAEVYFRNVKIKILP